MLLEEDVLSQRDIELSFSKDTSGKGAKGKKRKTKNVTKFIYLFHSYNHR